MSAVGCPPPLKMYLVLLSVCFVLVLLLESSLRKPITMGRNEASFPHRGGERRPSRGNQGLIPEKGKKTFTAERALGALRGIRRFPASLLVVKPPKEIERMLGYGASSFSF